MAALRLRNQTGRSVCIRIAERPQLYGDDMGWLIIYAASQPAETPATFLSPAVRVLVIVRGVDAEAASRLAAL